MGRRVLAEAIGTAMLVMVVVGSGIAASRLSADPGLQLLENALATAAGLAVIILAVGPVSGAHLNPVVSLADWWFGGLSPAELAAYAGAQVGGGLAGCALANLMYAEPAFAWSPTRRTGGHLLLAEVVATAGLLLVVFALARTRRTAAAPAAVGAYIGAAYFFTSSTSFANPAVTVARSVTRTFAGIAPESVPWFVLAQLGGLVLGVLVVRTLYPEADRGTDRVVRLRAQRRPLTDGGGAAETPRGRVG